MEVPHFRAPCPPFTSSSPKIHRRFLRRFIKNHFPPNYFMNSFRSRFSQNCPGRPPPRGFFYRNPYRVQYPQVEEGGKQKTKIETHHKKFVLSSHISCSLGTSKAVMQLGMSTIITSASFVGRRRRILSLCMSSSQMRKQAEDP